MSSCCSCFGPLALKIGLITPEQLAHARRSDSPVDLALVRAGCLSRSLAERVRETLLAAGCRHARPAA